MEKFIEKNEEELKVKNENVNFFYDMYLKKWEMIKNSYDLLTSKANFLFASATGFIYILVLLIKKCDHIIDFILTTFAVLIYVRIIKISYDAYKPQDFSF